MKEKRINRIIKSINNYSDDVNNVRTMKVAIDIKNMSQEMKEKLDILLEDLKRNNPFSIQPLISPLAHFILCLCPEPYFSYS